MAKMGFWQWLIVGIATALVFGGFIQELQQSKWNLAAIGLLIFMAYVIYDKLYRG